MSHDSVTDTSRPSSAVVLAAGEGTRLRPLTANRPKPMLPAGSQPILERVLDALIDANVTEIHLIVGYKGNRVKSYFGPTYREIPLRYHTQPNQLGSGHALLQARERISESFLLVNGDQTIDSRIVEKVSAAHTTAATISVVEGSQAADYGGVKMPVLNDNKITTFSEQPSSDEFRLFNGGVYGLTQKIFEILESLSADRGELPVTDAVQELVDDERYTVTGVRTEYFWMDATHPWDLLSLSRELLNRGWVAPEASNEDCYVAETANIHPNATLIGPVVVDNNAVVEPGAVVGPYAAIGESVRIGAGTVLRDVVVDTDTAIGANTAATDLVVGQGCTLGSAFTASGGPTDIILNERVYTGVDLGGVIADRVTIGGNVTLEPGALIGPGVTIGDGVVVSGNIEANSEVIR